VYRLSLPARHLLDGHHEDTTDAARHLRRGGDRLHHQVDGPVVDHDLELELRDEVHPVFDAAVELGVCPVRVGASDVAQGDVGDADTGQGLSHVLKDPRIDGGLDFPHG